MCGICGILEFGSKRIASRDLLRRMTQTMVHRGPDDEGFYCGAGIGFGFRRLSIIDVAGGHQPLSNEDGSIWVMLNGEIYNYAELAEHLLGLGHRLSTRSDTETIVHLYEEYGENCFARLRGMFAIALWDSRSRKLLLARDRVGKKPLYYAADRERIVFGSEMKCLFASDPPPPREIDRQALCDYFSFGYIPAPKTIYSSVLKLSPGHYLAISEGDLKLRQYWDISFGHTQTRTEDEWCEILRHQLSEATRLRLMSEVPLGAFLSGGLDSSAVVAMMAQATNRPVTTCCVGFGEEEYDESVHARTVAGKFQTEHHEQVLHPQAIDIIDKLVWHFDEPFADSSAIPTYYVSSAARRHVTVALGGDGGDENFAGYRRYRFDHIENRVRRLAPEVLRRGIFGPLGTLYPGLAWAPQFLRAKATFQSLARSPIEGYFNSISVFRPDEKKDLFTPEFQACLGGYDSIEVLRQHYERSDTLDPLSRIQYVDIKTYLADDILTKVDRTSMAVSLEVRAPLLDHVLMETAASIPSCLKIARNQGKYIFKKALTPMLGPETVNRKKQGFAVPLDRWFRSDLRGLIEDSVNSLNGGILNAKYVRNIWNEHQRGQFNRSAHLWAILMFHRWTEKFRPGLPPAN